MTDSGPDETIVPDLPRSDMSAPPDPVVARPAPLPLPPGSIGAGPRKSRRKSVAAVAVVGAAALLGACALIAFWAISFVGSGALETFVSTGTQGPVGVLSSRWAGGDRYAVVEYASGGAASVTSVIAWDARTGETTKVDGFRLVSTEPASTQVWLTKAVSPSYQVGDSMSEAEMSPWAQESWGDITSDGPGTAWSWDVASPAEPPVKVDAPAWTAWAGPSGTVALLECDPKVGLWPNSVTFSTSGGTVRASIPGTTDSFRPIGWSQSGRYFAYLDSNMYADIESNVTILDALDGSVVASYETSVNVVREVTESLDGAVWDPTRDVLWVAASMAGRLSTSTVTVRALSPSGKVTPLADTRYRDAPAYSACMLGSDADGVLFLVQGGDDGTLWRIAGDTVTELGGLSGAYYGVMDDSYRKATGLLVSADRESMDASDSNMSDEISSAAVVNLDGTMLRRIWPKP